MSNAELRTIDRYTALMQELRVIAKWFNRVHGGPDIDANEVEDAELRSITRGMIARRSECGTDIRDIEKYAAANSIELPE